LAKRTQLDLDLGPLATK